MDAWTTQFHTVDPNGAISYKPTGSGEGLRQFVAGDVDFAASDESLTIGQLARANARCGGEIVQVPIYVSPIAIIYNVPGVPDLQLDPTTLAGIFNGKLKRWNAPEIAADNAGKQLPDLPITTVSRADKSGTTFNFTDYLATAGATAWPHPVADTWPVADGSGVEGTSEVVKAVGEHGGAIGYADASQAAALSQAKVKVGDNYVGPSAEAAAKVLASSQRTAGASRYSWAYTLARDTTASGAYPVILVSYGIACARYPDPAKANSVKAVLGYLISASAQDTAAKAAGSAPLTEAMRTQITPATQAVSDNKSR
jgi:phosphate transport system substrate-binding protein